MSPFLSMLTHTHVNAGILKVHVVAGSTQWPLSFKCLLHVTQERYPTGRRKLTFLVAKLLPTPPPKKILVMATTKRVLTLNIPSLARQRCLSSWGPRMTPWFFCNFSTV